MFNVKEKQWLSGEFEKLVLSLNHPEMPKEKPRFSIRVEGKENWSWAELKPNWTFGVENPPSVNPFNEISRKIHDRKAK